MNPQLKILIVEDSEDDLLLLLRELRRSGYVLDYMRVETADQMQAALEHQTWDIVIADYTLPRFSAPEALQLLQHQHQDLPFIIVSGTIGEETAVAAMRAGAHDYLLKDNLARLVPAIERELREARERQKRLDAEQALRESEERFRQLAENITESVFWISDPTAPQMLYVSPAYERIWGRSCASLATNFMEWIEAIHPEDRQRIHTSFFEHSLAGNSDREYRIVRPDGSIRWIRARGFPIKDRAGVPYRVVGIAEDITEHKLTEAALRRTERLESLGTLTSGIAHDLNNVLTPILGIVQLLPLKIANMDESTQGLLQILHDSTQRGADLVKQILSFTRGIESKPTDTQVRELLLELQKIIQQAFPKNIELSIDLAPDLWTIEADSTMLHQVFMNLCVNARDAMPNGGKLAIVAKNFPIDESYALMHLEAQVGAYITIEIADTGTGIRPEILDRIFDPFFTTKEIGKGTGLGLSTVIGIVKGHHGFINVDSEVGKGSRFKVYLPATATSTAAPAVKTAPPSGQGELILVVDDEVAIQEITKVTLETYGYRAITASDGIEAIALYAEHKQEIAFVLLDMMMPLLDSETIIRTLSQLNPQVQIIAMSGLATNESVRKTMGEGVRAFLAKPFTAAELLKLL
ncbi:hybrid sensor histidine kinase/response regulator [Chamaesiphon minutus]|uniref:histidine kinase n=1 Tax=Chamaesiphon minutus (strain ATCC 27169 / PCC 6605) TaxID=1173020 RepID=K9UE93_CHAP6|nr:response regulator [Chamaesiphon minutus]AFY93432.1 PAS domain S-box [Chamaesiphon minutus PCC 6605]